MEILTSEKIGFDPDAQRRHDDRKRESQRLERIKEAKEKEKRDKEYFVAPIPKRGEPIPKTGQHYGHGKNIGNISANPARGRGEFRTLNGNGHRDRPLSGNQDFHRVKPMNPADRESLICKKTLEERNLKREFKNLDPNDFLRLEHEYTGDTKQYNKSRIDEVDNKINKVIKDPHDMIPEELKRYSAEGQRQANALEMEENRAKRGESLSKEEKEAENWAKKVDNFGKDKKQPLRKSSHVTRILK